MRLKIVSIGLIALVVVCAVGTGWWFLQAEPPAGAPDKMNLPTKAALVTQIAFDHKGPPPWDEGNHIHLSVDPGKPDAAMYFVVNMHAENFYRIVAQLKIDTIEVLRLNEKYCLITDPRIPRAWLLKAPSETATTPEMRKDLATKHADHFRQP